MHSTSLAAVSLTRASQALLEGAAAAWPQTARPSAAMTKPIVLFETFIGGASRATFFHRRPDKPRATRDRYQRKGERNHEIRPLCPGPRRGAGRRERRGATGPAAGSAVPADRGAARSALPWRAAPGGGRHRPDAR